MLTYKKYDSILIILGEYLSSFHALFIGQVLNSYYQEMWYCGNESLPPNYVNICNLEERVKGGMFLFTCKILAAEIIPTHSIIINICVLPYFFVTTQFGK